MPTSYRTPPFAPTQEYIPLEEYRTTVARVPEPAEDMPTVTVSARFDWKFWLGIVVAGYAGYLLLKSMQRAARHG